MVRAHTVIASLILGAACVQTYSKGVEGEDRSVPRQPPGGYYRQFLDEYRKSKVEQNAYKSLVVVGHVDRPGRIPPVSCSLKKALELAGGFSSLADTRHVGIWKNAEGRFIIVDAKSDNPALDEGDVVIVIERWLLGF
jgi:hypothetical protein